MTFVAESDLKTKETVSLRTKGGHGPEFSLTGRAGLFLPMHGPGRASPRAKNLRAKISVTGQEWRGKVAKAAESFES